MVKRMGDWAYHKLKPQSEETRRKMIRNEFGGINESFYNLYAITGDDNYRWLAEYFYHNDVIDPLKELRDDLGTKHTNTFIPKVIAEARNYELTQNEVSRKLADFFWHTMIDHHTFAPGCSSQKEHFFDTAHFSKFLNGYTGETCCTYNMLKLSRHLFCWTGDVKVADYYERALYNHILGQQDPESGMVCYFLPLLNGAHKVDSLFWKLDSDVQDVLPVGAVGRYKISHSGKIYLQSHLPLLTQDLAYVCGDKRAAVYRFISKVQQCKLDGDKLMFYSSDDSLIFYRKK